MKRDLPMAPEDLYAQLGLRPRLPVCFDNSATSTYCRCPRLFYYSYVLARRPEPTFAMDYGSAWHRMHEVFHKTGSMTEALEAADEFVPEAVDDRYGRSRSKIKESFTQHVEYFQHVDSKLEVIMVEEPAEAYCPIGADCVYGWGGCNLRHGGRLDRLIRFQGKLWIHDYKTSTRSEQYFADSLILDPQFIGYAWIYSHQVGEKIWGVIADRTVSNKSTFDPNRYPSVISDGMVEQWVKNQATVQWEIREKFNKFSHDMAPWIQNPNECFRWGRPCAFHSICAVGDEHSRLKSLVVDFQEKEHDFYNL